MSGPRDIVVVEADARHEDGLAALFTDANSPCFCRYWHFEGDKNAWLERSFLAPEESRRELSEALRTSSDEARGVVALDHTGVLIGWLKIAPASSMSKLYGQRLYKGLACFEGDRTGVFTLGCALVHPEHRHRGVATELIQGAVRIAPRFGARALEAFPRRPNAPVSDEELWTGPCSAYVRAGFSPVNDFAPYPVMRLDLRAIV